jgi:hypothetical protein
VWGDLDPGLHRRRDSPYLLPTLGRAPNRLTVFQSYRMKMLLPALPFWRRKRQNLAGDLALGKE